jgi:hypothetical protein
MPMCLKKVAMWAGRFEIALWSQTFTTASMGLMEGEIAVRGMFSSVKTEPLCVRRYPFTVTLEAVAVQYNGSP